MPEIWLEYGPTHVVLDVKAENLERQIDPAGANLNEPEIISKLQSVDITKPIELVVLDYTKAVHKTVSLLLDLCNQKTVPKPKILVDKPDLNLVKNMFADPEISISSFNDAQLSGTNLMFVNEMMFDGLFGYSTVSTKLLRRFGKDEMLEAYNKRNGNLPHPGEDMPAMDVAKRFADQFEVSSMEVVSNSAGIVDLASGHPSDTLALSKSLTSVAVREVERQRIFFISAGEESSGETLSKSFSSLWNCTSALKDDGLAILLAECKGGLGSEALLQYVEGRMNTDRLKNPTKYVDGMEDLLFLNEIQKRLKIGIVSILPQYYTKEKLSMIPFGGVKEAMDYILKTYGQRQKVTVVSDSSHVLLR